MNASIVTDDLEQAVYIGRAQLGQLAIFNHHANHRMIALESFQNLNVGGIAGFGFFDNRQLQLLKQNLTKHFGRVDVKLPSCLSVNLRRQLVNPLCQCIAKRPQCIRLESIKLHRGEHAFQRQFDVAKQVIHALLFDIPHNFLCHFLYGSRMIRQRAQRSFPPAERRKGVLRFIIRNRRQFLIQIRKRHFFQSVSGFRRIQQIGAKRRITGKIRRLDAFLQQRQKIRLAVVHSQRILSGKQLLQNRVPALRSDLIGTQQVGGIFREHADSLQRVRSS